MDTFTHIAFGLVYTCGSIQYMVKHTSLQTNNINSHWKSMVSYGTCWSLCHAEIQASLPSLELTLINQITSSQTKIMLLSHESHYLTVVALQQYLAKQTFMYVCKHVCQQGCVYQCIHMCLHVCVPHSKNQGILPHGKVLECLCRISFSGLLVAAVFLRAWMFFSFTSAWILVLIFHILRFH